MKPLKGNKKIEDLFASGKRVSSSFLHCICLFNDCDGARFVVSVPKKNFTLAVKRNKIKRLLREVIRKNSSSFECFDSGWFMFVFYLFLHVSFLFLFFRARGPGKVAPGGPKKTDYC